jgi:hypothetical protein
VRFVAIADTHTSQPELPEGDVLLHAGDLTYRGTLPEVNGAAAWLQEQKYLKGFTHVIVIAGNHDWLFQKEPGVARQIMKERGLIYLEDSGLTLEGSNILPGEITPGPGRITIYGSPWQPWFHDWAFNLHRGKPIKEKWDRIPPGVDILMTHGPPYEILDGVGRSNEDISPDDDSAFIQRVGCEDLLGTIRRLKPKIHVFGHIHASYGRIERDGTTFINASIMNEAYDPEHKPWAFDFPKEAEPRCD